MRVPSLFILFLLLSAVVNFTMAADEDIDVDDPDVIRLADDTFDSIVNAHDLILVEFYAPWCGHCKALAPEYAKAATALKGKVALAKLDATKNSATANKFDVSGYPTLKIFRNGESSAYDGPRKADGIVKYMLRQVGPAAKPVESLAELNDWYEGKKTSDEEQFFVLGVFEAKSYTTTRSAFLVLSNKLRTEFTFLQSHAPEVIEKYGEGIHVLKRYDEKHAKYGSEDTRTKVVEAWIREHSTPLVGEYNEKTRDGYIKSEMPVAVLYTTVLMRGDGDDKHRRYVMNRIRPLAEEYRGRIKVAWASKSDEAQELESLGLQKSTHEQPHILVVHEHSSRDKYVLEKPFNKNNVLAFVRDYLDGKGVKHVKSEPVPANNDGPVTVVTGKTFSSVVADDKDVILEFYAPWCGHCRALEPKYEKVGKKFATKYDSSVVVAKIDATANDYPSDYEVSGYPTLYFKPAGSSSPVKYEGGREAKDIIKYIKQNAKKPITKKQKKKSTM